MKGTTKVRHQGYRDPLLVEVMKSHGFNKIPLYEHRAPETMAIRSGWRDQGKLRDGPVNPVPAEFANPAEAAESIKGKARALGADDVGIARLTPVMINDDADLPHEFVICMIISEDYAETQGGPRAIENEAMHS
ncbi:MAG: hypothetical protein V3S07_07095, partial [Micropepsaceae bacterium]